MKRLLFSLIIAWTQNGFCQDSIFKINGEIISSKITEINSTLIKFKKINNLNGPQYSELKNGVRWIKFENGTVDTIHAEAEIIPQVTQVVPTQTVVQKRSLIIARNDNELFMAIEVLPSSDSKTKLKREYALMKHYRSNQYLANGLGLGVGFAVPVVVTVATLRNFNSGYLTYNPVTTIIIGALAGAAIRITGQVLKYMNKNKRLHARENIYRIYNEMP